ncbi:MAG: hypothetical protein E6G44_12250, partial [Actinobacteria bacterium]
MPLSTRKRSCFAPRRRAGRRPGRVGSPAEHPGGRRARLAALRECPIRGRSHLRERGASARDAERPLLLPPGHDRERAPIDGRRPAGPFPRARHQPELLHPLVEGGGPHPGSFGGGSMRAARRVLAVIAATVCLLLGVGVAAAPTASAHPLGNFTVNRYSGIAISPGRVEVRYVLDMAEIPTFQERAKIDANGDGVETDEERQEYANVEAARLLRGLTLTVRGAAIALRPVGAALRYLPGQAGLPTLRLEAGFAAGLPSSGSAQYRDRNFPGRIGWKEITVRPEAGVTVTGSTVPVVSVSRELLAYPKDLLSSPLDVTRADFAFRPGQSSNAVPAPPRGPAVSNVPIASGGAFAALVRWRLTPLLLLASLMLAFLFGAVHALGPGHGKTITAAYLVGSGARVGQAVAVGASVALMHTASVLSLGLVLFVLARSFPAEQVYPWLTMVMGLVALGL